MNKADTVLNEAMRFAADAPTWADLSNALFAPYDGVVTKAYPTAADRAAFAKTPQFAEIQDLVDAAIRRTGLVEGATPTKSGRFVVRVPVSMHAALEREASEEKVSLNQLIVAKLAVQLKEHTRVSRKSSFRRSSHR